jgi:hypothetical protein
MNWSHRGDGLLPRLPIPDGLSYEERTIRLVWENASDRAECTDNCNWDWIDLENDVEQILAWDDLKISPEEFDLVLSEFDAWDFGAALIELFGEAKNINYGQYPRRLQPYLQSSVIKTKT